ncbi:GNAT family N-acetyltransferase [Aliiroseovarius crassostreae]|uniref:GNAT family N-acetyltransferase n=1 Tax=Aliiroseovarius crassostreae TaxID=154981 RepID=UPI0022010DE2|nr:GNAT family N-acetyltransferase [Aliiroseovarius crassostreae]UWP91020.1 GNAT family N-acetyltransferase [Aliiroseovarius crassostreae]
MDNLIIRAVEARDLRALGDLVSSLARHHGDTARVTQSGLARDCLGQAPWLRILVAEHHGGLVGYAALCPQARLQFGARGMELHHLFVHRPLRGQGVGRALLTAARELSHQMEADFLTVAAEAGNAAAQSFYEAAGFRALPDDTARYQMVV